MWWKLGLCSSIFWNWVILQTYLTQYLISFKSFYLTGLVLMQFLRSCKVEKQLNSSWNLYWNDRKSSVMFMIFITFNSRKLHSSPLENCIPTFSFTLEQGMIPIWRSFPKTFIQNQFSSADPNACLDMLWENMSTPSRICLARTSVLKRFKNS